MADLQIDIDRTISVGNEVSEKGADFESLLNRINSINAELPSYWVGKDITKYCNAVEEQAKEMQKLADTINEIGVFIIEAANTYLNTTESNANAIRG